MKNLHHLLFLFSTFSIAQVGIGINSPNPNSLLELNSSDQGLILPRLNLVATGDESPLSSHVEGMIVYNTSTSNDVSEGLYYNDGSNWVKMTTDSPRIGDLKNGFQSSDHNGWYLLDGRGVVTLPPSAQTNATNLGLVNLPNSTDRFLKTTTGAETLGSTGGTTVVTLTQANLPNITFTGNTSSNGSHTHTYVDNNTTTGTAGSGSNNPIASTNSINTNTSASGSHSHTISVPSGGSGTQINFTPSFLITNVFIYLGN